MTTKTRSTAASVTVIGRLAVTRGVSLFLLLLVAAPIAVGLSARQAWIRTELPDIGLDVDSELGVESRDSRWQGVQQRDRIVAVDGVPVRDPADWIDKALAHRGELAVTFSRGGEQFTRAALVRPLHWSDRGAVWARVATAAALMAMGLAVFVARPGVALTWLMLVLAWDLGAFLLVKIAFWSDPRLVKVLNLYPWAIATAVGLHFLAYFPQRLEWLAKRSRAIWLYLPVVAAPILHVLGLETRASIVGTAYATLTTLVIITVVGAQYRRVRRSKDARARSQYRALLVGFVAGLVVPAAWNWLRITLDVWNSPWAAYYNALPMTLFIGVTSYAVVRHNALAIDRFTAAVVGYGVTTILVGGLFAAALVGIPLVLGSGFGESPVLLVATTALTFASFAPAYRAIKRWVDRRFFREHANVAQVADALRELVLAMQQSSRDEAVEAAFAATQILKADRTELWLLSGDQELALDRRAGGAPGADEKISLAGPLGQALASGVTAGIADLAPRALESAAQDELWQRELAMIAPIRVHGIGFGFIGVGRKRSGIGYTIEELSFLTIVGAQLGAVLERTQSETQLDRYHLERRIGTGGMAEVFLAWQVGPGGFERKVALKRPLPHVSEDPNAVASFLDEAKLAAQLVHPNIAQVYDVGESNGSYYIVMEYVDGPSLRQVLRDASEAKKPLPMSFAVAIANGMLSALEYAHHVRDERGRALELVHRDVSPRNILLNRSGQPKLVDFGIARAQFQLHVTRTGIVKGTLPYMSPEQANDQALDHRADLYSVAVVLYEMLTGEMPFPKGPTGKRAKPIPASALDRVLRRATEASPSQRYETAAELAAAIADAIAPEKAMEQGAIVELLKELCPKYMGDGTVAPVEVEPEATGERTVAERTVELGPRREES